jgi:16S rRNA G966 N2-methylase RsmD
MANDTINMKKLFPEPPNKQYDFLVDKDSLSYITTPSNADIITRLIIRESSMCIFKKLHEITIFDATACIGGDTISFCKKFNNVISTEIDADRFLKLSHNISQYNFKNVSLYNDNYTNILDKYDNIDIIYFDPPWGGKDYKLQSSVKLYINNDSLSDITNHIGTNKQNIRMIVFKLPKNFDLKNFYQNFNQKIFDASIAQLAKMQILFVIRKF